MATNLSGSLSEFTVAEALSLVAMGGRTARMQVTGPTSVGTVHLVGGQVSSATADRDHAALLRSVVAAVPVKAADLALAVSSQEPVRSLVESGFVDRLAVQRVAGEQCAEAIGEMLGWASGEFEVWVGEGDPRDIGLRVDVEELASSARARVQEWHDLRKALPALDSVLVLVPDVPDAPAVDAEDWSVLARVDGHRTLDEILAVTGAPGLGVGRRLVDLMSRGLVSVREGGGEADHEETSRMLDAFEARGAAEEVVGYGTFEAEQAPMQADAMPVAAHAAVPVDVPLGPELHQGTEPRPDVYEHVAPEADPIEQVVFAAPDEQFPTESAEWVPDPVPAAPVDPVSVDAVAFQSELTGNVRAEAMEPPPGDTASYSADPVASLDQASSEFAWSPWAHEMGLGEGPVGPAFSFQPAEGTLEADGFAPSDIESLPAPRAPLPTEPPTRDGAWAVEAVAPAAPPEHRLPNHAGTAERQMPSPEVGAHGMEPLSTPDPVTTPAEEPPARAGDPQPEPALDPLAEGLLAQLMSSVRGL